ncbi:hypothetical protein F385_3921 [Pantoea agglomerans 299R]|nr:hypothetical protein F385_3921 [Pantoea agglomerans 299R]
MPSIVSDFPPWTRRCFECFFQILPGDLVITLIELEIAIKIKRVEIYFHCPQVGVIENY